MPIQSSPQAAACPLGKERWHSEMPGWPCSLNSLCATKLKYASLIPRALGQALGLLSNEILDYVAVDVCQPEVAALIPVGKFSVINTELV